MWLKWFPWRWIVRKVARNKGFIDPIALLSHLHRFAQPSEVAAPLELLRAGVVFHARGLMNTGAIQHNLDWVWPYWVERQFDPHDPAFIPRAFSITHVNLTHRNWTAVGLPELDWLPLVDPRGLVTPFWDGWSIDAWIVGDDGHTRLLPSRAAEVEQRLDLSDGVAVITQTREPGMSLLARTEVIDDHGVPTCRSTYTAETARDAWLAISLRPTNPEGVSFVHQIALDDAAGQWTVNSERFVRFDQPAQRHALATYRRGDVATRLPAATPEKSLHCEVGMATGAAMFRINAGQPRELAVSVPRLHVGEAAQHTAEPWQASNWDSALAGHCALRCPDARIQEIYDIALRTLVLHSPGDVYPGPYTYKRFWFRDAAFILQAMLIAGMDRRVAAVLNRFPERQTRAGYFLSQEGEWDSNGAALWILNLYGKLTGKKLPESWKSNVLRGGRWIVRKRLSDDLTAVHAGLLPAGFSAEHLGPNDYYYWDDFWSVAGLHAAAEMLEGWNERRDAGDLSREATKLSAAIRRSLADSQATREHPGIPASPHRRMDAGAIGSIVAGYPLQLLPADDAALLATADFLIEHSFVDGGFFQDMIHSGINPYLTLHVAQVLLRAGDRRFEGMLQTVARLASPTGQWPEAIHPRTLGGCMGDGQHVWAAAEWVMMVRNCFVREDGDTLILGSGLLSEWLDSGETLSLGPTLTPFGPITVTVQPTEDGPRVSWHAAWRNGEPRIEVRLPGLPPQFVTRGQTSIIGRTVPERVAAP